MIITREPPPRGGRLITVKRVICALLLAMLAAAVTACGAPASAVAGRTPRPAGTAGGSGPARRCAAHVVARQSANGRTVCVAVGGELIVVLPAGNGTSWSQPHLTGAGLGPGHPVPTPASLAGWSFKAISAGTAVIRMTRPLCPPAKPGTASCDAMIGYLLHVKVG